MLFKKKENETIGNDLKKICALLIHAAKIDEDFSDKEQKIIKETMLKIGVRKDNFKKLLQKMNYKIFEKENETFFKYSPTKKFKKITTKKISNENPFKILKNLNLS